MSIQNRRFIRFLLDIPAVKRKSENQTSETFIKQVSIGGCLIDWDDADFPGDVFRMELQLPNKNLLPLMCKVIYKFENTGVGVKFSDITRFEQELLASVISERLEEEGLPLLVDPFSTPPGFSEKNTSLMDEKIKRESMIEEVVASES